jgi:hypothetical protein
MAAAKNILLMQNVRRRRTMKVKKKKVQHKNIKTVGRNISP